MSRIIHCENCSKQTINNAIKYNELVGSLKGKARIDYVCDACGSAINKEETCFAITLIPTQNTSWMNDYIN